MDGAARTESLEGMTRDVTTGLAAHPSSRAARSVSSASTLNTRLTLIYVRGVLPPARSESHAAYGSRGGSKRAVIALGLTHA